MSLSRTVALVTGGASGLGAATARFLQAQGARVCVADLQGPTVVDVTNADSVSQALDDIEADFGEPPSLVVHCAGVAPARKMLSKKGQPHSLDEFAHAIHVNTIGTFNVCRLAAERMQHREPDEDGLRGLLIPTASIAAYEGQKGQVAYAASKAAVVGMTLPMARDLAELGIRVVTIVRSGV